MARLGPILGRISPPPWGAPGRLQEVIFRLFWDAPAEILKTTFCLSFFTYLEFFNAISCPKGGPTGQINSHFAPQGSSGVLLGRLGRQVGLRRTLWAEKRNLKIVWRALGTILGSGQVSRKMQSQYGPTCAGKGHENRRPWV